MKISYFINKDRNKRLMDYVDFKSAVYFKPVTANQQYIFFNQLSHYISLSRLLGLGSKSNSIESVRIKTGSVLNDLLQSHFDQFFSGGNRH